MPCYTTLFSAKSNQRRTSCFGQFLHVTAVTAIVDLSHLNSVRLSVHLSVCLTVTLVDQSKTVQARITKSSPSAAWWTLV